MFIALPAPLTRAYPSAYPLGMHSRLIIRSLNCLYFDSENESSFLYQCYSELTDSGENFYTMLSRAQVDYDSSPFLQQKHYWNPYTKRGLYGDVGAPYHAQTHFEVAVKSYLGLDGYPVNKSHAYYELGKVIHLIQDLTVPFHARNDPSQPHAAYEDFCYRTLCKNKFTLTTSGEYSAQVDWSGQRNAGGWVHQAALAAAPCYHSLIDDQSEVHWFVVAQELINTAISLVAGFLFYFWQYVHNIDYDLDGLTATAEVQYNTDHTSADTDIDSIDDYEETVPGIDGYITDPATDDTDHDGYSDFDEIYVHFSDPTNCYDNPYYFVPLDCRQFIGISDNHSYIHFYWLQPKNFLLDWHYRLFLLDGSEEVLLYSGTERYFTFYPLKQAEFYSYRVYCYKSDNIRSIYLQWSGSVLGTHSQNEGRK